MVHRTAWDEVDDTPKPERDLGIVRIKKEIQIKQEIKQKAVKKEDTIKKFKKLSKRKKKALLNKVFERRKIRRKNIKRKRVMSKQIRQTVTFQETKPIQVLKTRQPNEPSHYFKQSDNQEAKFIGKYRVK